MPFKPDEIMIVIFFNACAQLLNDQTKKRSKEVLKRLPENFLKNTILVNSAIDMLMRFGDVHGAEHLFNKLECKTVVSYGAMMKGNLLY